MTGTRCVIYRTALDFQGAQEQVGTARGVYCPEAEEVDFWTSRGLGFVLDLCFNSDRQKNAKNRPVEMCAD